MPGAFWGGWRGNILFPLLLEIIIIHNDKYFHINQRNSKKNICLPRVSPDTLSVQGPQVYNQNTCFPLQAQNHLLDTSHRSAKNNEKNYFSKSSERIFLTDTPTFFSPTKKKWRKHQSLAQIFFLSSQTIRSGENLTSLKKEEQKMANLETWVRIWIVLLRKAWSFRINTWPAPSARHHGFLSSLEPTQAGLWVFAALSIEVNR